MPNFKGLSAIAYCAERWHIHAIKTELGMMRTHWKKLCTRRFGNITQPFAINENMQIGTALTYPKVVQRISNQGHKTSCGVARFLAKCSAHNHYLPGRAGKMEADCESTSHTTSLNQTGKRRTIT
ncbi:hypothetical protein HJG60_007970 [Phyllostomus discolor]|uniref:Uncharacterized protein n=1 Tax=Phyllostomus discolor TaxID=89673 RepID=A0A834BLD7_9CHIR|nr:hypothetical protein HJG60_007970 [Phyllostomus discolor]